MVTVQAAGCAPIVRAFGAGAEKATPWEDAHTIADGLRVPKAIGDFLVLRAVRESDGAAVAVGDAEMVAGMQRPRPLEGISAAPEGGAALHALRVLVGEGRIKPHDTRRRLQHRRRAEVPRRACTETRTHGLRR